MDVRVSWTELATPRDALITTSPTETYIPNVCPTPTKIPEVSDKVTVEVRYFAGARAAAGIAQESLALPAGSTVADAARTAAELHGANLAKVIASSSFLLDGIAVRSRDTRLSDGVQLDVLPPFAGG
jgi:sulfur-carrier protein